MSNKFKIFLISSLVVISLLFLPRIYERIFYPEGLKNLDKCKSLQKGLKDSELINYLGTPIASHNKKEGKLLMFKTAFLESENIEAKVDNDGLVVGIKCAEGEEWK